MSDNKRIKNDPLNGGGGEYNAYDMLRLYATCLFNVNGRSLQCQHVVTGKEGAGEIRSSQDKLHF